MSRSIVTFLNAPDSIDNVLEQLEEVVNIRFVKNSQVNSMLFEARTMGLFISLYPNGGYIDEPDMKFSDYNVVIDVGAVLSPIPPDVRIEWALAFSKTLVCLLADCVTGYMITDDLQSVCEFRPNS